MCCSASKVRLPSHEQLPESLFSFIMNILPEYYHVMNGIGKYNISFQMTFFGAK